MTIQMTRRTTRKITRRGFAALAGGFLVSTSAHQVTLAAPAVAPKTPTRNVFQQPFGVNSIWNTPIGLGGGGLVSGGTGPHGGKVYRYANSTGPVYEYAGITITNGSDPDESEILFGPASPLQQMYSNRVGWDGDPSQRCSGNRTATGIYLPTPTNALFSGTTSGDPCASGTSGNGNFCLVALLADRRTIVQNQPTQICTVGGSATTTNYYWTNVDLFADETTATKSAYGAHGGSNLSALGGIIRMNEIIPGNCPILPGVADVMRHALGTDFNGHVLDAFTTSHVWPATTNDAANEGLLVALLPTFNINSLTTIPARSIAWTLMNYGAYVNDDAADSNMNFDWEYSYGDSTVNCPTGRAACQFKQQWGHGPQTWSGLNSYFTDIQTIANNLYVITNNAPSTIGGGAGSGGRLQPMAAPAVDQGVIAASPVVSGSSFSISHTASAGQFIGQVAAANYPYLWTLTGIGASNFWIQPTTGLIYTAVANITTGTYTLTATAQNIVGSATGTVTFTVS